MAENIVSPEEMETLMKHFSELGARIAFQMCMKFVEEIKINYPNVPKEEFIKLAVEIFKKNNLQVDAKVLTSRSKLKEEEKCTKILPK